MKIHKEGYLTLSVLLLAFLMLNWGSYYFFASIPWLQYGILALSSLGYFFILQFFRDPVRKIEQDEMHILAPADGKIVVIEETHEPEFLKERRIQISIFMSPLNVHINRSPVEGKIVYYKYHKGKYLVAWHPKSSTENERTSLAIEKKGKGTLLLRQIAGAVARRIVSYAKEGEAFGQGQEFGFIKFGSRVDIFLPLNASIKVKLGDKSIAGKTILATW